MPERPSTRRSTSWALPRSREDEGAGRRDPPLATAAAAGEEEGDGGTPAPATPYAAMHRLGWTAEQVAARKAL
eukprot:4028086-Alexandrium_andersonii.AAC.1